MKRSLLNKWIARLEDPATKKGVGVLKDREGGMCCLGVLCDIIKPDSWIPHSTETHSFSWENILVEHYLPDNLADDIDMDVSVTPFYTTDGSLISLAELNDQSNSFAPIIKVLKNAPQLYIWAIEEDL